MSKTLALTKILIGRSSITPYDAGCQQIIIDRLRCFDFFFETFNRGNVTNLWGIRKGVGGMHAPRLIFAGHTDVVPPGPIENWQFHPFKATHHNGLLYGRGAADMKTSVASFVIAIEEFVSMFPKHNGSIGLLLTSDEEGLAIEGTKIVVDALLARGEKIDYCVVGEPTSSRKFGDTIKNGRRGSLSGNLTVQGIQGHVAYPHDACNAVHMVIPALKELISTTWDTGNSYFPPTTFQISNLHAGEGVTNVIPGNVNIDFNFRFSTESNDKDLKDRVKKILLRNGLDISNYRITWMTTAEPFLTPTGKLVEVTKASVIEETGVCPMLSTGGGTSDARFLATFATEVVEFGPINSSIHKIDEHVAIDTIDPLKNIYRRILEQLII